MTVALSIAIFATTHEIDKSLKWELWLYGQLVIAGRGQPWVGLRLEVVAGSFNLVTMLMD